MPKPGIPELLERLAPEPGVTLALLTGNLERGARIKLEPPGLQPLFPLRRVRQRLGGPLRASGDRGRAGARAGPDGSFNGKSIVIVGDSVHDVACGRSLGVRSVAVATGPTPAGAPRSGAARRAVRELRGRRPRGGGDPRMRRARSSCSLSRLAAGAVSCSAARRRRSGPPPAARRPPASRQRPAPRRSGQGSLRRASRGRAHDRDHDPDARGARHPRVAVAASGTTWRTRSFSRDLPAVRLAIQDSGRGEDVFERDFAAAFDENDADVRLRFPVDPRGDGPLADASRRGRSASGGHRPPGVARARRRSCPATGRSRRSSTSICRSAWRGSADHVVLRGRTAARSWSSTSRAPSASRKGSRSKAASRGSPA